MLRRFVFEMDNNSCFSHNLLDSLLEVRPAVALKEEDVAILISSSYFNLMAAGSSTLYLKQSPSLPHET